MKTFTDEKTKRQFLAKEIILVLSIAGQNFPQYVEKYSEILRHLKDNYIFIPRFLAEARTLFYGALVEKKCFRLFLFYRI
jgi:hypothetical protein